MIARDVLCPRCRSVHSQLRFHALTDLDEQGVPRPTLTYIKYWAMCPETGQPVLAPANLGTLAPGKPLGPIGYTAIPFSTEHV